MADVITIAQSEREPAKIVFTLKQIAERLAVLGTLSSATGSVSSVPYSTATNLTSITLTNGDWNVFGNTRFAVNSGTPSVTRLLASFHAASNSVATALDRVSEVWGPGAGFSSTSPMVTVGPTQVTVSGAATTTLYLNVFVSASTGALNANGLITARRVG